MQFQTKEAERTHLFSRRKSLPKKKKKGNVSKKPLQLALFLHPEELNFDMHCLLSLLSLITKGQGLKQVN